jgi:hypothetical protein
VQFEKGMEREREREEEEEWETGLKTLRSPHITATTRYLGNRQIYSCSKSCRAEKEASRVARQISWICGKGKVDWGQ